MSWVIARLHVLISTGSVSNEKTVAAPKGTSPVQIMAGTLSNRPLMKIQIATHLHFGLTSAKAWPLKGDATMKRRATGSAATGHLDRQAQALGFLRTIFMSHLNLPQSPHH